MRSVRSRAACWTAAACVVLTAGCGMIADKDRIRIAKVRGEYVTRGDLFRALREMNDEDRPVISTKNDLVRVLKRYVDKKVKDPIADGLLAEEKIRRPRQEAMQRFFAKYPEENFQLIFQVEDPKQLGMSEAEFRATKEAIEVEVDKIERELLGDMAVLYLAREAVEAGELTITQEDLEQEYAMRKEELVKPEHIHFLGIQFPADEPDSQERAAQVRRRIEAGESFETLVEEYLEKDKKYIVDSDIQNEAGNSFRGFWMNAAGAQAGAIVGPVFMPSYRAFRLDERGRPVAEVRPDAYVVLKVLERNEARTKTIEEAKLELSVPILQRKMMERLRQEHGVEIYRDSVPDPAILGAGGGGDPMAGAEDF